MIALFLRGWLMVTLVATNTIQIAHGRTTGAMLVGFCISYVWWQASSKHRPDGKWAGLVYAAGAALGTCTGIWIGAKWG
jgi:uncharacterized membrane protein YfcA